MSSWLWLISMCYRDCGLIAREWVEAGVEGPMVKAGI